MAPKRTTRALSLAVVMALAAAACGSSGDDSETVHAPMEASDADAPEAARPGAGKSAVTDQGMEADGFVGGGTDGAVGERAAAPPGGDEAATADDSTFADSTFADYGVRPFVDTAADPLSTFALDVDTASYAVGRSWLSQGQLPPSESVRVEEYVNSFHYDYPVPGDGLAISADAGPSPFDPANVVVRVGVQAENVANDQRPPASLTFVVDTSGSMDRQNRLALVKTSLRRLVTELGPEDSVAIVTYGDDAEVLLEPTSVRDEAVIIRAIDSLEPTGSTNLEAGLRRGYDLAGDSFREGGINRVVLASDGVANVGLTDPDGLVSVIRDDADRGVQLVTVGVGMGNFNDVIMEQLADDGDGFYAYVDDEAEAERLFADDLVATLLTVAFDAKIQVDFDADTVARYRLIGFENRAVLDEDFRNDAVDAGELGAGHQVTALYELTLHDDVRAGDGLGTVQLRWTDPDDGNAREAELPLTGELLESDWESTPEDFRLAVTVGAFAELLRHSPYAGDLTFDAVGTDAGRLSPGSGAIEELAELIGTARSLS